MVTKRVFLSILLTLSVRYLGNVESLEPSEIVEKTSVFGLTALQLLL